MGTPYTSVSVSGYNASPPSDDGTQVDSNKVYWSTAKTKLGDPLNTAIAAIDSALVTAFNFTAAEKTADYTTVAGDNGKIIEIGSTVSSAVTITLGQVASMGTSYIVKVVNRSTISQTIVRGGSDTINGSLTSITIPSKASLTFQVNASNNGYDVIAGHGYATGNFTVDGTTTLTGVATLTAQPVLSSLTASQAVFTDGSKGLVSNAITGSGNVVMSTSPTFATSVIGGSTMAVFNTTSTTINAFGAATTLNIGNSGGTNTILGVSNFSQGVNGTLGATTPAAADVTTLGASGTIRSTGQVAPASGIGTEMIYTTEGVILAYDRGGSLYKNMAVDGANVTRASGTNVVTVGSNSASVAGTVTATYNSGTPFVANTTTTGIWGHLALQRSAVIKGYIGLDASDRPALLDGAGGVKVFWDTSGMNGVLGATTPAAADVTTLGASGTIRSTGQVAPASGIGTEMIYTTEGVILAYDRGGSLYKNMAVDGANVYLRASGTNVVTVGSNSASVAGTVTATYNSGTPFVANTTTTGIWGHLALQRSAVIKGYIGLDASDRPALLDGAGGVKVFWDTSGMNGVLGATTPAAATVTTLSATATIKAGGYTVATLPANSAGIFAYVTDQLTTAAAKGVAPTGGGAVVCYVMNTGAGWVGI